MITNAAEKTTVEDIIGKSISGLSGLGLLDLEDVLNASDLISKVISLTKGSSLKPGVILTEEERAFFYIALQVKMFYHPKLDVGKPHVDYNLGLATYLTLASDLVNNDNLKNVIQERYTIRPLDCLYSGSGGDYLIWNNVGYEHNYSFSFIKLKDAGENKRLYLFVVESERVPEKDRKNGKNIETYDVCVVFQENDLVKISFEQCKDKHIDMLSKATCFDLSQYVGKPLPNNAFTEGIEKTID